MSDFSNSLHSFQDAIFTSCGHLFCSRGCTGLNSGERGRCDYCGQECETCSLCGQGLGLPEETRRYLFSSIEDELQQLINIIAYHRLQRDIHLQNVRDIIQKQNEQVRKAEEEAKAGKNALRQMELYREEITRLKNEVQVLASENQELKKRRIYSESRAKSPSLSNYSMLPRSTEHTSRTATCISPIYRPMTNGIHFICYTKVSLLNAVERIYL
ncbi:uncharacterized protein Gasu_09150 [Galdieria sulphuraria]|uniref:Uncharacterized protein n=1 Tax=Galdieria sulphuraria TaxID=130081 RepID=M2W7Q5_GALSU|nr:uncharacterized protein Gasu_09150 [Galdieria sulphuraria]EME31841.1 hypothetical protein Gasu_09150 [Galdieria sulphuraria]|eukprot:XP_005708361.1 hypothetical protein Gasu_09150 [Galdieria sulphuraria]